MTASLSTPRFTTNYRVLFHYSLFEMYVACLKLCNKSKRRTTPMSKSSHRLIPYFDMQYLDYHKVYRNTAVY